LSLKQQQLRIQKLRLAFEIAKTPAEADIARSKLHAALAEDTPILTPRLATVAPTTLHAASNVNQAPAHQPPERSVDSRNASLDDNEEEDEEQLGGKEEAADDAGDDD